MLWGGHEQGETQFDQQGFGVLGDEREKYILRRGPNEEQPVPDTKLQRLYKTVLQNTPHFRYRVPFWRAKTIATQHKSTMEREGGHWGAITRDEGTAQPPRK